jgi:hypothetical protein
MVEIRCQFSKFLLCTFEFPLLFFALLDLSSLSNIMKFLYPVQIAQETVILRAKESEVLLTSVEVMVVFTTNVTSVVSLNHNGLRIEETSLKRVSTKSIRYNH